MFMKHFKQDNKCSWNTSSKIINVHECSWHFKQDNKCSWNTSSKIINVHETLQAR